MISWLFSFFLACAVAREESLPLALDDECGSELSSSKCAFSALQRDGSQRTAKTDAVPPGAEGIRSDSALVQTAHRSDRLNESVMQGWQGNRETMTSCMFVQCDEANLGAVECHHWRCVCRQGYYYDHSLGQCASIAKDTETNRRNTGGTCFFTSCSKSRGWTACENNLCLCWEGFVNQDGKCVRDEAGTADASSNPATTTAQQEAASNSETKEAGKSQSEALPEPAVPTHVAVAATTTLATTSASCRNLASPGSTCYDAIQHSISDDIWVHPELYPGLTALSAEVDFQKALAQSGKCTDPCT